MRFLCVGFLFAIGACAQDAGSLPRFEVASIRPSTLNSTGSSNDFGGGNVVFRNYTLGGILVNAFGVERQNLEMPAWVYDERFDITAKVPDEKTSFAQRQQMLQELLMSRFGLVVHRETKTRSGYALVVAKNGPKIQAVPDEGGHMNDSPPGKIERLRTTIDAFASTVGDVLKQPVVDETHMEGRYNVLVKYAPDRGGAPASAEDGPSIFTAIEDQLGLKLEARKLPVEVIVVDRLQKMPSEN